MQKIMIRHVRNVRGLPVKYVNENDFYEIRLKEAELKDQKMQGLEDIPDYKEEFLRELTSPL